MPWPFPRRSRSPVEHARVAPWLIVGPVLDAEGYRALRDDGVTHVLDLRSEDSDDPELMRRLGLAWTRVPIDDRTAPTNQQLAEVQAWLDEANEQPVVYVHCEGGLGRSPTVAIALLIQRGFTHAEAHRFVTTARSVASPTADQHAWLTDLDRDRR